MIFLSAILPGSYPSERSRSVESAAVGNIPLEEHDLPPSPSPRKIAKEATPSVSQGIEEPGQHEALYGLCEAPGKFSHPTRIPPTSDITASSVASHKLSQRKRLEEHMDDQVNTSASQAREDLGKHARFGDRSKGPGKIPYPIHQRLISRFIQRCLTLLKFEMRIARKLDTEVILRFQSVRLLPYMCHLS